MRFPPYPTNPKKISDRDRKYHNATPPAFLSSLSIANRHGIEEVFFPAVKPLRFVYSSRIMTRVCFMAYWERLRRIHTWIRLRILRSACVLTHSIYMAEYSFFHHKCQHQYWITVDYQVFEDNHIRMYF